MKNQLKINPSASEILPEDRRWATPHRRRSPSKSPTQLKLITESNNTYFFSFKIYL
ncbi:hypothetical protein H6G18_15465 [Anabaena subtropica FACHB-260]|uniref:Uncharacterized protein n=1 Tax=Anabaena subtropica FACHB-260 TaxID=2692884 RepID=A0ABR8CRW7_9NOST|nr:hypothetical protein [Anabaena subtropica FACHB-260]